MAIWKKYNAETGEYEPINGAETGSSGGIVSKDTIGVDDAYTTYTMGDIADSTSVGSSMTTYTITGLIKGDTVKWKRSYNGQGGTLRDGDGNDLSSLVTWSNYTYGTFVLYQDYAKLVVQNQTGYESDALVLKRTSEMLKRPAVNGEFVPTISDDNEDVSTLKTFSTEKIRNDYGMDVQKAKDVLSGGVWIALGDSYTVYADSQFKAIAERYGMIYDGQGKVSSTVCGDAGGNKGFSPFWNRMDGFISNYTGDGQTIGDDVYTAEDVKLITFMGGANDGGGTDSFIGSPTSKDTMYICGSCNYMFSKLLETFPNARIIIILQPGHYNDTVASVTTDESAIQVGFANLAEMQNYSDYEYSYHLMVKKEKAIKGCAERYGLHIVDCILDWYSVVNPTHRATYWSTDKIHLTTAGSNALAEKLEKEGILKLFG